MSRICCVQSPRRLWNSAQPETGPNPSQPWFSYADGSHACPGCRVEAVQILDFVKSIFLHTEGVWAQAPAPNPVHPCCSPADLSPEFTEFPDAYRIDHPSGDQEVGGLRRKSIKKLSAAQ